MRFIYFIFTNFLMGFLFTFVFSVVVMAMLYPLGYLYNKIHPKLLIALMFIPGVVQYFVVFLWCAYLAEKTILISNHESVHYGWLYVVAGFLSATAPLRYMAGKEAQLDRQANDVSAKKQTTQLLMITLAAIAFLVFYFYPPTMNFIYGWFLNWWFKL